MTLGELLDAMAGLGANVNVDGERLRYRGPRLAADATVRRALATFHDEVLWLAVSGRLCVFCPRMLADGHKIACPEHQRQIDATVMPWEMSAGISVTTDSDPEVS